MRGRRPSGPCSVPGCEREQHALGLCGSHYNKQYQKTTSKGAGKQGGSFYPQELVRGIPKGWGSIG